MLASGVQEQPIPGYEGLLENDVEDVPEMEMAADPTLPGAPSWLQGTFMVGGPHGKELGGYSFTHGLDGFSRLIRFKLKKGTGSRLSGSVEMKMMQSEWWQKSKEQGHPAASVTFGDTSPSLNASFLQKIRGPTDNCYVQQEYFNGQYWGSTDDTKVITYSEDLKDFQLVKWQDSLESHLYQAAQVAHAVQVPNSSKLVGLLSQTPLIPLMKGKMTIYQIDARTPFKREELVTVTVPKTPYEHSFGMGGDWAIIADHPWTIDSSALMKGSYVQDAMRVDVNGSTTFYLVNLKTKETQAFKAPPYMIFHFTNVFSNEAGDIVFDQPTWRGCNGYAIFEYSVFLNKQKRDAFRDSCENVLRRFVLHRSGPHAGTMSTEILSKGWYEYPQFNHMWRGRASCFIYLTEWYHNGGEDADMALVKFDTFKKQRIEWYQRGHFPGEPKFIPRPGASDEDDGVIVSAVLDGASQTSYFLILDARTMAPLERYAIGRLVPLVVHGVWKFSGTGEAVEHSHGAAQSMLQYV